MTRKIFKALLLAALFSLGMSGCAVDSVEITEHTSRTDPGGTVTAKFMQGVLVVSNGSRLIQAIRRDSLHFAVGLPGGWTATAVQYYAALHFHPLRDYFHDGAIDTNQLVLAMLDSQAAFETRKQAMGTDNGMLSYFQGLSMTASDTAGNDTTLNADSAGQWAGYRGSLGLNIPAGTVMDTFFIDTAGTLGFDTIGITFIPLFVYVTLKAGSVAGEYPVFYYGKSGPMPDPLDTSSLNIDAGDFVFFRVRVGPIAVENLPLLSGSRGLWLDAFPNPAPGAVSVRFSVPEHAPAGLEVYSVNGALVKKLPAGEIRAPGIAAWNGRDQKDNRVHPGTYVLRLNAGSQCISKQVQIVR